MENCIYRTSSLQVRAAGYHTTKIVEQSYLRLDAPLADLVSTCSGSDAMVRMGSLMLQTYGSEKADYDCCVYAIEAQGFDHTKVGTSHTPLKRFSVLQVAHFAELKIAGMIWVRNHREAERIETLVRKAAIEMDIHARGDWIATDARESIELILKAARYAEASVADSGQALRNLSARTMALFGIKRGAREAIPNAA